MAHVDYATSKKNVVIGLALLAIITLIEVGLSLFMPNMIGKLFILGLSLYKAYYIMYKFMHLGDEVKGLRLAIILPFILLAWGLIAFLQEGNAWKNRRSIILDPVKTEMYNHKDDPAATHDTHEGHSMDTHGTDEHHKDEHKSEEHSEHH